MDGEPAVECGTHRGSWRTWTCRPPAPLTEAVHGYHGFVVDSGEPTSDTVFPTPTDQEYGSREYMARDPEGNLWSFGTYPGAQA